jgi:UDP-3-O-[3-hydroxymyristoyl] N-acetylglucosamine deacetylase
VQQSTIARRVTWTGTGLHGGEDVEISLCPAAVDTGIVFVSLAGAADGSDVEIPARARNVLSSSRATTLATPLEPEDEAGRPSSRVRMATVEHLLATLFALDLDNVRIEVRGSEIPVMDGSALPLLERVRQAGRKTQSASRHVLSIREGIAVEEGDRWIRVDPAETLRISYAIDFPHPCIGRQTFEIESLDEALFERELAGARTFGFAHEVAALRDAGLAHGGSFENAIVLDETRVLNVEGLRWPDEFVRHKIIDLLGDLALLGAPLVGHVQVEKGGHRLHHRIVDALVEADSQDQDAKSSSSRASAAVLAGLVN